LIEICWGILQKFGDAKNPKIPKKEDSHFAEKTQSPNLVAPNKTSVLQCTEEPNLGSSVHQRTEHTKFWCRKRPKNQKFGLCRDSGKIRNAERNRRTNIGSLAARRTEETEFQSRRRPNSAIHGTIIANKRNLTSMEF